MSTYNINSGFLSILFIVAFFSCSEPGDKYKTTGSGLEYKYLKENRKGETVYVDDYIELKFSYRNNKDSVLFDSDEIGSSIKMRLKPSMYMASFEEAVKMLKTGERALFKIPADLFYSVTKRTNVPNWVKKGDKLIFDIELIRILDKKEIEKEQEQLKQKRKKEEEQKLQQYLKDNNITAQPTMSGLYYIEIQKGNGALVQAGDFLLVHYTGKYIDDEIFDSSHKREEPFYFQQGKAEVIAGWEEGFSKMREGGKAKFIIPSHLAYGEKGYGKIIPPFSTLVFDVELIKVKK